MADASPYSARDLDWNFDLGEPQICKYLPVDLRDGRFAVFVIHRESREWWRLVAIFSTWDRAERYAEVETECQYDLREPVAQEAETPVYLEVTTPAPATLPPEPPTGLRAPEKPADDLSNLPPTLLAELSPGTLAAAIVPEPLSDKPCARCGAMLPTRRANNPQAKYCSPGCSAAAQKERDEARKAGTAPSPEPVLYKEPKQPGEPCIDCGRPRSAGSGQRCAECYHKQAAERAAAPASAEDEIARFIAERGVTKLPPDPRLESSKQ